MQNPNDTAFQTNLVPTIESGSTLAPELRQQDLVDLPISISYDSEDVQGHKLKLSWVNGHGRKRRKRSYLLHSAEFIHSALVMLHAVLGQVQVS